MYKQIRVYRLFVGNERLTSNGRKMAVKFPFLLKKSLDCVFFDVESIGTIASPTVLDFGPISGSFRCRMHLTVRISLSKNQTSIGVKGGRPKCWKPVQIVLVGP